MAIELKVPSLGESVAEVYIGEWYLKPGDSVDEDGPIVELESEKATVDLPAPVSGTITEVLKKSGEQAEVGEVIGYMEEGEGAGGSDDAAESAPKEATAEKPAATKNESTETRVMPAAQRLLDQHGLDASDITPTGPGGRLLKEDVMRHVDGSSSSPDSAPAASPSLAARSEEAVPMSPIRRKIAQRLVESQQNAAILTTFNEVDLSAVKALRANYQSKFQDKYGIKLGFMSFFVKAAVEALKAIPEVNAEIRENEIIYKNYYDIGVAVGGGKGLVVPVLRDADQLSFAETEVAIADFATRAQKNKLSIDELTGGTFTISNGGVYGSLLSTPIINPPQSGVLGMHGIQDRPVVRNGEIVIRPMMYLALSYDHRIVDGKEAVTFLKRIADVVEDPSRMLLEV